MNQQTNIAVFASGSGSNFEAMLREETLLDKIRILICDKLGAPVIERAERYRVPVLVLQPSDFKDKATYEQHILTRLKEYEISWIFLAGYMRLIGPVLLQSFAKRIVNIHPSLLPAFPGLDAVGQALEAGAEQTGVTIHYVDDGMDTGPIIMQQHVSILPGDTKETLTTRLQEVEHLIYPETIKTLIKQ